MFNVGVEFCLTMILSYGVKCLQEGSLLIEDLYVRPVTGNFLFLVLNQLQLANKLAWGATSYLQAFAAFCSDLLRFGNCI